MRSTRSGALSRFLPYRSPEFWAPRSELFFFNVLFGFLPFLAAVFGFSGCGVAALRRVADPHDPLHRLDRPADAEEQRRGVVRVGGRLRGGDLCLFTHETQNGKDSTEDWRETVSAAAIDTGDGAPVAVTWSRASWEPQVHLHESTRAIAIRALPYPAGVRSIPRGGRILEGCLSEGTPVFVAGCQIPGPLAGTTVGGCGAAPLVITPGDGTARPRLASLGASIAGETSLLGMAMLIVVFYLWRVTGARPFADAVVRRLRRPLVPLVAPTGVLIAPLAAPALLLFALVLVPHVFAGPVRASVSRPGFALAAFVATIGLVVGARMIDRRRALGAAMASVRAGTSRPLARLREGEAVALDAEVDPAAPAAPAPLTNAARAHWVVTTTRVFRAGSNHKSEPGPEHRGPMLVRLRGADGAALLDLTHAAVDLRARRARIPGKRLRGERAALVGGAPEPTSFYVLEERFLDPGEAVHVIGRVQRFEATPGGAIPVIGGVPGDLAVVHAGSRRSLLRGLAVERGYLAAAVPICFAVALTIAGLSSWLASR